MLGEVLRWLSPTSGGRYVDGTIGWGGHAAAILTASGPDGWLFGCDRDGDAIEGARANLAPFAGRFELRHGSYERLAEWLPDGSCDGVLLDLGVSSPQLDRAERGFSFLHDGPLDMRMDRSQGTTAADLVNQAAPAELVKIFRELGEEPRAWQVARAIERERERSAIVRTRQLAELIERVAPRQGRRLHPATRVFQALRLAVNEELARLAKGLEAGWSRLKPQGRLLVITFHSLEARLVKEFARERERDYRVPGAVDVPELREPCPPQLRRLTRKPVLPEPAEVDLNPRARSAQLRAFEKL